MSQLLDAIVRHVPQPKANLDGPFQMLFVLVIKYMVCEATNLALRKLKKERFVALCNLVANCDWNLEVEE
ncbi:hypothetical protein HRI_002340300 [Hibiscus trionum]|uniref:Uncharacterized protein n=1 Tax=Hibiscus trionum TaxID=183268 RepID=A0A9W7I372_HIBTR|nr:hypothetical protein HRI_002340300 [Hibiscus trionum]